MPTNTTHERKAAYMRLHQGIPQNMVGNEALETISVINNLAARSYDRTLVTDWPDFIKMVNHTFEQLHRSTGKSWDDIQKQMGHHFRRLANKITYVNELAAQVVYPGNIEAPKPAPVAGASANNQVVNPPPSAPPSGTSEAVSGALGAIVAPKPDAGANPLMNTLREWVKSSSKKSKPVDAISKAIADARDEDGVEIEDEPSLPGA